MKGFAEPIRFFIAITIKILGGGSHTKFVIAWRALIRATAWRIQNQFAGQVLQIQKFSPGVTPHNF